MKMHSDLRLLRDFACAHWPILLVIALLLALAGRLLIPGDARSFILAAGGIIGFPLALWRSVVADRQATAAAKQAEVALKQAETAAQQADIAERGLRNDRYQKAAEMLGNAAMATRMGGLHTLQRLAREYPQEYHIDIMQLLCAFVRYPTKDDTIEEKMKGSITIQRCRADVEQAMHSIGSRSQEGRQIEKMFTGQKDESGEGLGLLNLEDSDLSGIILSNYDFSGAAIHGAMLSGAILDRVKGLTQQQLDFACACKNHPPKIMNSFCAETGEPLEWKGGMGST